MATRIFYGVDGKYRDVTDLCKKHFLKDGILNIPETDIERAKYLGDHIPNVHKHILVFEGESTKIIDGKEVSISPKYPFYDKFSEKWFDRSMVDPIEKLNTIHRNILFEGGRMKDEYEEQIMSCTYIKPGNVVLELGGNIGRNSLVIATLLENSENLVVLETDPDSCVKLERNKNLNGYRFKVVNAAISDKKLIQNYWTCIQSETLLPGYFPVKTMTFSDFKEDYPLKFDTLVADCEGALYYILQDFPDFLNGITTIIVENDYKSVEHYNVVRQKFLDEGFELNYTKPFVCPMPCKNYFYQVWKK